MYDFVLTSVVVYSHLFFLISKYDAMRDNLWLSIAVARGKYPLDLEIMHVGQTKLRKQWTAWEFVV